MPWHPHDVMVMSGYASWVGVTLFFNFSIRKFSILQKHMLEYLNHIHSLAAATSAKDERDIPYVNSILIILKNWKNNETEEIGLVTPTLDYTLLYSLNLTVLVLPWVWGCLWICPLSISADSFFISFYRFADTGLQPHMSWCVVSITMTS